MAATKEPFLRIKGTKGLTVRGLTFRCGRGCGVVADGTEDLVFERNVVEKFGLNGVESLHTTRARFSRCVFRTFGSSGLVLRGGVQIHGGKDNLIVNNLFAGCDTMLSVTPWSRKHRLEWWRERALDRIERDTQPFSEIWRKAYGDLSALRDAPPRETLRRNILVGGKGLYHYNGATNLYAVVAEDNVCLPAGADWTSVKGFDPLPPESALGIRSAR